MGFLDFFIEREEKAPEPVKVSPKSGPPVLGEKPYIMGESTPSQTTVLPSQPSQAPQPGDLEKFREHFSQVFSDANLPGPDYHEFSITCDAMSALPEDTRFPAAYAGLSVQGLNRTKLLESARLYLGVLDEDTRNFESAVDSRLMGEASRKKEEAQKKRQGLVEKRALIEQLTRELSTEESHAAELDKQAEELQRTADIKKKTYLSAAEEMRKRIQNDITAIERLIK